MNQKWDIEEIAHFFFLLVNATDTSGKNILEKRFKKDPETYKKLISVLSMIGVLGYKDGLKFGFSAHYFDSIKSSVSHLIEIRKFSDLWRVLGYNSMQNELVVMLDAFESHKHTSTTKAAQSVRGKAKIVEAFLEWSD